MAGQDGKKKDASKQPGKLRYFFLNIEGDDGKSVPMLHKKLHINRGTDTIITWCYPLEKRIAYTYSYTKKVREPAFTTIQTGKLINRGQLALERAILAGSISEPPSTYTLTKEKKKVKYMWHEKNILEAHAYFSTVHFGRPRNDGLVTPRLLPTVRELRAMIRQEEMLFIKDEDGEFRPVWRART